MREAIINPVSVMCPDTGSGGAVVQFPKAAAARTGVRDRLVFTKATAKKLACPIGKAEHLYRDSQLHGFILRCYANGRRVWLVQYRDQTGATRRVNIGDAAVIEADAAREKAKNLLAEARHGDPAEKRDEARKAMKFGDATGQYLVHAASKVKPATLKETRRNLIVHCRGFHTAPVRTVSRARIAELHDSLSDKNGKVVANRVLAALSTFFSWAIGRGIVEANPIIQMPRNSEKPRDRVLSNGELKAIWKATESNDDFSRIVRLLLLTGTRRSEVGDMRWSEMNDSLWTVQSLRSKNGLPHEIPLTEKAQACLPAAQEEANTSPFVFGKRANSGFSGWSKAKANLDKAIGFNDWSLHDLRRTFSTKLHDELGVAPHIVEALLNHVSGHKSGVGGTYNKAQYRTPKREALEAWTSLVGKIVEAD